MLHLRILKEIRSINSSYKCFHKRTLITGNANRTYAYRSLLLAGGALSCGSCVAWSACQGINDVSHDEVEEKDWGSWFAGKYNENIRHSSTFRFGRTAFTVVSVFFDYKYTLSGLDSKSEEYKKIKSECHLRSAIKLRDLCSINGGVFMKVGQHIGSMDFMFPKEYTQTLKCFQYSAPESSLEDVKDVIENDTKQSMKDLFISFEEKPIGSASLAQVHKAVLKNGGEVAVKVQHKTVKYAYQDAVVIQFFVDIASKLFPEFQFQWLVDQINTNLPKELNFLNEGNNCEKMGRYLQKFKNISVPKIIWGPSTERVLFMEFVNGGMVDDINYIKKNKLSVEQISTELGKLYSEMIFVRGDIHCDPHPGNILVRKSKTNNGTEVILLDHGLYVKMKDTVRVNYCQLWQSMIERDLEGIKAYSEALGVGKYYGIFACMVSGRSWDAIQSGITEKPLSTDEVGEIQTNALQFVSLITEVLELMPRELVLVFKTNDLLRGLDARLKTRATSGSFISMSKCCLRAIYAEEYTKCNSLTSRCHLYGKLKWNEFRLAMYQLSLFSPSLAVKDFFGECKNKLLSLSSLLFTFVT